MGMIVYWVRNGLYLLIKYIGLIGMYARYWAPIPYVIYMYMQSDGSTAEIFVLVFSTLIFCAFVWFVALLCGIALAINEDCKPDPALKHQFPNALVFRYFLFAVVVAPLVLYLRSMITVLPQESVAKNKQYKTQSPMARITDKKEASKASNTLPKTDWNHLYLLPGKNFSFSKLKITRSYQQLITAARNGDSDAKIRVAMLYMHGVGVTQNFDKAAYWFKQAAQDKHPQGQKMYGYTFYGKQNNEAFSYMLKAARQGDIEAQYLTSKFYLEGIGVNRSKEKSEYWFNKATAKDIFRE